MNREDVIRMAREAAAQHGHTIKPTDEIVETLTSFALIVEYEASKKAHERGYQLGLEIGAAAERERLHDKFMEIHKSQQHSNNYWHVAARKIKEEA